MADSEATTGSTLKPGHELNVVHGEDVGRIGHRNGEGRTNARKRHDLIANGGFLRNELDDGRIDFIEFQIDRRNAVLARQNCGDIFVANKSKFHQASPSRPPFFFW